MRAHISRSLIAVAVAGALLGVGMLGPARTDDLLDTGQAGGSSGRVTDLATLAAKADESSDPLLLAELGSAYVTKASATGDPSFLGKAEKALSRSLSLQADQNPAATTGMAQLSNARHDFRASVRWARRAISDNPYAAAPHGLLGDALFELGRVRAADASYQRMLDLRPDMASYIRASYALGYAGRPGRALRVLEMALRSVPTGSEEAAFILHQQGDVLYGQKRFSAAEEANRTGMRLAPGFAPPMVGVAESLLGQGRYEEAVPLMEEAVRLLPSFSYLSALADLHTLLGNTSEAQRVSQAAQTSLQALRDNGVLPDNDLILFDLGSERDLNEIEAEARGIYDDRPTAKTADSLAWLLFTKGEFKEAHRYAAQALRLDPNEPNHHFHSAAIAERLGRDNLAAKHANRALRMDPAFSLPDLAEARRIAKLAR